MPRNSNCCFLAARHPDAAVCCTPLTISTTKERGTRDARPSFGAGHRVARGSSLQEGIDGGDRHWRGRCINRRRNGGNAALSWWCCMAGGGGGGGVIHGLDNGRGETLNPKP
jgi:hypothetical protein